MKRFLMLVGVAVVAAAMYVAAATGSQQAKAPTAKQFKALKKQVTSLNKTVKSLKADEAKTKTLASAAAAVLTACDQVAVPIDQFGNPQPASGPAEGYEYGSGTFPSPTNEFFTTGLDVTDPTQDTGALWITGGDGTCNQLLNTSGLRHAAAKAGVKLSHPSAHLPTFVAHQR
jgi:hypothetical protein